MVGVLWDAKLVKNNQKMGYFEIRFFGLVWAFYDFLKFYTGIPFINP